MGQRSQIYVKVTDGEKTGVVARYFQWNYGERMVSRARATIEYLKDYIDRYGVDFLFSYDSNLQKLTRIIETNFDMRDVAITSDILEECKEYGFDDIFESQDNNDGQLYIDVTPEGIKYAFVHGDYSVPLDGDEYMDSDYYIDEEGSWMDKFRESDYYDEKDLEYTIDNIKYLWNNATIMTSEDVKAFHDFDYTPFITK